MTITITRRDALRVLHALALAYKAARREEDADELARLYDELVARIKKEGADHDKSGSFKPN